MKTNLLQNKNIIFNKLDVVNKKIGIQIDFTFVFYTFSYIGKKQYPRFYNFFHIHNSSKLNIEF